MPCLQDSSLSIDPDVFLRSLETGDAQALENWLNAGVSPDTCNDFGMTGLHVAAAAGDLASVTLLLAFGAQPDAACQDGWTPVCEAARSQQAAVLKLLLARGARPDLPQPWSAFQAAIRSKAGADTFSALLSQLDLATLGPHGESMLQLATMARHADAVEALLEAGAGVPVDARGECPLLYLALSQSTEAIFLTLLRQVENQVSPSCLSTALTLHSTGRPTRALDALLEAGADPLHPGASGICAIERTCREGNLPLLIHLTQARGLHLPSAVHAWVSDGALQTVRKEESSFFSEQSQQQGPRRLHAWDPDTRKTLRPYLACLNYLSKQLPLQPCADLLMVSILGGEPDLCQALLGLGADPDACDSFGRRPLVEAVGRPWGQPLQAVLLQAGADVNAQSAQGDTPLLTAIQVDEGMYRDQTATVAELLRRGASLELARPQDGTTPLLQAIQNNSDRLCRMLLDAGASPHAADLRGQTPLIRSVVRGNLKVCSMLLESGANPYVADREGRIAYHHMRCREDGFHALFARHHGELLGRDFLVQSEHYLFKKS